MKSDKEHTGKTKDVKEKGSFSDYILWFGKNIIIAGIAGLLIFKLLESQQGYSWAYNSLLKGNMELINNYPNATIEQKFELKLGSSYAYLQFLKANTPANAVILYPDRSAFFPKDKKSQFTFTGEPFNKMWALRFLYPRKLVIPSEVGVNHYSNEVTHVAIVNGWGLDKLKYQPTDSIEFGVLPINNPTK